MPSLLRSPASRWAVPVVAITAVGAAVGFGSVLAGASSPDLPERSAADAAPRRVEMHYIGG